MLFICAASICHCIFSGHYIMWLMLCVHYLIYLCFLVRSLFPVDIWSVGCIMGEMVKGSVIFQGTDRILYRSHRLRATHPISSIFHPPSSLPFISKCFPVIPTKHNLLKKTNQEFQHTPIYNLPCVPCPLQW